jgi:hypothetical protein
MNMNERILYHQIHPAKLATDVSTALVATLLLWQHRLGAALLIGLLPPVVVSAALLKWGELERLQQSAFGRYVAGFMTRRVEAVRIVGLLFLWGGAWQRSFPALFLGAGIIILAWLYGVPRLLANRSLHR